MKTLLTVALIFVAQAHGKSNVNCNGMSAVSIGENTSGSQERPQKPAQTQTAGPRTKSPGQR